MDRRIDAPGEAAEHALHLQREGPRAHQAFLGAAQLRRRDHLHGLGDLLRVLDRTHAPAEIDERRHRRSAQAAVALLAANVAANSFTAALSVPFSWSSSCFFSAMFAEQLRRGAVSMN